MAGYACVLKHASNVTGCALAIGDLLREAGFPEHLFTVLCLRADAVERVLERREVRAVTLTGSAAAGRAIAAAAGRLLKKSVLELGGSDPYVVLGDAELEPTVEACVSSRLINSGQSCIAAKRFIVVEKLLGEFTERFVAKMRAKRVGNPVGRNSRKFPEKQRKDEHREEGLHDCPGRPQESLFVSYLHIAPGQEVEQFPVGPQFRQIQAHPLAARTDCHQGLIG